MIDIAALQALDRSAFPDPPPRVQRLGPAASLRARVDAAEQSILEAWSGTGRSAADLAGAFGLETVARVLGMRPSKLAAHVRRARAEREMGA